MKMLEQLTTGDVVEVEFKQRHIANVAGYVIIPYQTHLRLTEQNPRDSNYSKLNAKVIEYPIENILQISILKKFIEQDDGSGPLGRFRFCTDRES